MSQLARTIALPLALLAVHCGAGEQRPEPAAPSTPATPTPAQRRALPFLNAHAERTPTTRAPAQLTPTLAQPNPRTVPSPRTPPSIQLPSMGGAALFSTSGSASVVPGTVLGSASYTTAPVVDVQSSAPPSTVGGGAFDVTVNGVQYSSTLGESVAYTFTDQDPSGALTDYLAIGTWVVEQDPVTQIEYASVVYVLARAADFAPGATVALDGVERIAIFYHGDISLPDPQVAAVALTGDITFGAGSIALGATVDASVSGDFAEISIQPSQPPPPPVTPVGAIVAGTYDLGYAPSADAYCDGTLAGQEANFLSLLPADVGLADGVVTVALPAADVIEVAGAPGFGGAPLALGSDPSAPPGLFYAVVPSSGAGPLATNQVMQFLMLDDASASSTQVFGFAGVGFETADQLGFCQVGFEFALTP